MAAGPGATYPRGRAGRTQAWAGGEEKGEISRPGLSGAQLEAIWLSTPPTAPPDVGVRGAVARVWFRRVSLALGHVDSLSKPLVTLQNGENHHHPAARSLNEVAENLVTTSGKGTSTAMSLCPRSAGPMSPTYPRPCGGPPKSRALSQYLWINGWISETCTTEISWTNTGLAEVYAFV